LILHEALADAERPRNLEERAIKLGQGTGSRLELLRTGIRSEWV